MSDWMIIVGEKLYAVHRANLAVGPRASLYFRKLFVNQAASTFETKKKKSEDPKGKDLKSTNLSNRLPKDCWCVMDQALDFMYDGIFNPQQDTVILLCKTAIVLGMRELKSRTIDYILSSLTTSSALEYLKFSHLRCDQMEDVIKSSIHYTAINFNDVNSEDIISLPLPIFLEILEHEQLQTYDKNLSKCITAYIKNFDKKINFNPYVKEQTDSVSLQKKQESNSSTSLEEDNEKYKKKELYTDAILQLSFHLRNVALEDAMYLLGKASELDLPIIAQRCLDTLALYFDRISCEELVYIEPDVLMSLLSRNELNVENEDTVMEMILYYHDHRESIQKERESNDKALLKENQMRNNSNVFTDRDKDKKEQNKLNLKLTEEQSYGLWKACRFPFLSVDSYIKCLHNTTIPNGMLMEASIARMIVQEYGIDGVEPTRQIDKNVLNKSNRKERREKEKERKKVSEAKSFITNEKDKEVLDIEEHSNQKEVNNESSVSISSSTNTAYNSKMEKERSSDSFSSIISENGNYENIEDIPPYIPSETGFQNSLVVEGTGIASKESVKEDIGITTTTAAATTSTTVVAESEEIKETKKHESDSKISKLEAFLSTCKVLLPSQGVKREVAAINPNQLIPGCRVEFTQKSSIKHPTSGVTYTKAMRHQGILVSVNRFNKCDVLCDNGSYEVDVPAAEVKVLI